MKRFSPTGLSAAIMLATALAACGSSNSPKGSTGTTSTASNGNVTSTKGTTGNTNTTSNANTTTTTTTSGAATVSVTGSLGGVAFTGKDAVYASDSLEGIIIITAVVSDSANLCAAFSSTGSLDGNIVVIQLLTEAGGDITVGDYTVQDSNGTTTTTTNVTAGTTTASAGIAAVGLLTSGANSNEIDASSGDVKVTAYSANNPLVFTISAQAAGSATGIKGNVSAPACAALATALQSGTGGTDTTTKLAHARRVFTSNLH